MSPDFFPGCYSGGHCCSHNASILTGICTMQPTRTWSMGVRMFHRPLLKAVTHHQYIVPNMCSNLSICPSSFPQAYYTTLFKWLKLFKSTYSLEWYGCTLEWMLQTLFTSQSTTVTAYRVKTEGAKTGFLSVTWSLMNMTNVSLTLQSLNMHILYPGANERSPWGFSGSVQW